MLYGIDTSYANGTPSWTTALADSAVGFVYARVCYGANPAYDDGPAFVNAHDACKAHGTPFGSYFFWLMGQDAVAQADHFLAAADGMYGTLAPVVDVEEGSGAQGWGSSVQARVENLAATLDTIQAELGQPIIYTNPDTWATYFGNSDAFAGHRLWLAEYGVPPGDVTPIPGFTELVLHQYSNGTGQPPIPGLSVPGNNVDRDVLVAASLGALGARDAG